MISFSKYGKILDAKNLVEVMKNYYNSYISEGFSKKEIAEKLEDTFGNKLKSKIETIINEDNESRDIEDLYLYIENAKVLYEKYYLPIIKKLSVMKKNDSYSVDRQDSKIIYISERFLRP